MGVAFSSCTIPYNPQQNRIKNNQMEVGLGIHGEPGIGLQNFESSDKTVKLLIDHLLANRELDKIVV